MQPITKVRRTQAERTRASREKIISAATQFFSQQGFHGAVMAEIAASAGLTLPGLLHHFPNKNELLMAVLAERDRADKLRFEPVTSPTHHPPLYHLIRQVEYNETVPGLVQLFSILVSESAQIEHPAHGFFKQRYATLRITFTELLRAAQQKGDIRTDIPANQLAVMVISMMDGLQIQWLLDPSDVEMRTTFENFCRLMQTA